MSTLSTISFLCRPTKDPELQTTAKGTLYTKLDVAVNKGYGEKAHVNYYQCWLKNEAAERIIRAGVKKGSLIYITGDLDIQTYTKKDGTAGISPQIDVAQWCYAPFANSEAKANAPSKPAQTPPPAQTSAPGMYANNPYAAQPGSAPQFEELDDDEELPF